MTHSQGVRLGDREIKSQITEKELGIPFYPNSVDTGRDIDMKGFSVSQQYSDRTTSDSPEQVVAFYKSKLGNPDSEETDHGETSLDWGHNPSYEVTVSIKKGATDIAITRYDNHL